MNVENINTVIEAIRADDNPFSMSQYGNPACGTPACICGWANFLIDPTKSYLYDLGDHDRAADWFGIETWKIADHLFYGEDDNGAARLDAITREEAITTLNKLIETGKVDWSHCGIYREKDPVRER